MLSLKDIKKLDRDDVLELIGLESRRGPVEQFAPVLGAFAAGLLVGAGLGLLFAQKPGDQLRGDLRQRLQSGQDALSNAINGSRGEASSSQQVPPASRTA
ncbi:YtxH domain-containing protein [Myxococcaceae bacterium JPH2]|nr:YtxH domain-containing protein [Myxococcaceae bacterium JPH2]